MFLIILTIFARCNHVKVYGAGIIGHRKGGVGQGGYEG